MNFLVRGDEIHRVEFDGGAWIDIRRCLSRGERLDIMKQVRTATTRHVLNPETRRMESVTEIAWNDDLYARLLLRVIVKGWSDEQPVTPENVDAIPERMSSRLLAAFEELNPTDTEKSPSLGESETPSPAITE